MPANNGRVLGLPRACERLLLSFPTQLTFSPSSSTPLHSFYPPYRRLDLKLPSPLPSLNFPLRPQTLEMPSFKSVLASVALMALAFSPIAAASSGKSELLLPPLRFSVMGVGGLAKVERRVHSRVERA